MPVPLVMLSSTSGVKLQVSVVSPLMTTEPLLPVPVLVAAPLSSQPVGFCLVPEASAARAEKFTVVPKAYG